GPRPRGFRTNDGLARRVGAPLHPFPRQTPPPPVGDVGSDHFPGTRRPHREGASARFGGGAGRSGGVVSRGAGDGPGRTAAAATAPAVGPDAPGVARAALFAPDRGLLPPLGPALYPLPRQTPSARYGSGRGRAVSHPPGGAGARRRQHPKPGPQRPGVPVP